MPLGQPRHGPRAQTTVRVPPSFSRHTVRADKTAFGVSRSDELPFIWEGQIVESCPAARGGPWATASGSSHPVPSRQIVSMANASGWLHPAWRTMAACSRDGPTSESSGPARCIVQVQSAHSAPRSLELHGVMVILKPPTPRVGGKGSSRTAGRRQGAVAPPNSFHDLPHVGWTASTSTVKRLAPFRALSLSHDTTSWTSASGPVISVPAARRELSALGVVDQQQLLPPTHDRPCWNDIPDPPPRQNPRSFICTARVTEAH